MYKELGGNANGSITECPDAAESQQFWEKIWAVQTEHDGDAEWLEFVRRKMDGVLQMDDVVVTIELVKAGIRRMANWKAPGPDGVRGFWFKKLIPACSDDGDIARVCA